MKKIVSIIFILINIIIFSANIDSAGARQKAVNEAQRWVDQKIPYRWGVTDCSHLVSSCYGKAGLNMPTGSSPNGRYTQSIWNSNTKKILPGQENLLKPGDTVFFYRSGAKGIGHTGIVVENPSAACGGGPMIIDTNSPKNPPRKKCLKDHKGYQGAISFDEIIRANGHTPVNQNGQVISPVGVPTGSVGSAGGTWTGNPANLDETYEVSWDGMLEDYENMIFEGLDKSLDGLLILLTLLTVIQLLKAAIPYLIEGSVNIYKDFITVLIKYCFYAFLLKNYATVITMMYKIFTGIGAIFVDNNHVSTLDELFAVSTKESLTVFKLIDQYHFDFIKILIPGSNLFDITFWKVVILILVVIMIWYFAIRIVFEMMTVFIQFFLGFGLSYIMFSLATNDVTREMGKRPLRTMIGAGLRVTMTVLFSSVVFGILEKAGFGDVTLDTVRIETMFIFIASGLLMAFLMNRISKIADSLNS